jgi:protein transport protein SEC31
VAPLGLIAGGMSDGTIAVWSAAKLLAAGVTDAESAPESDVKLFVFAVTAVEFNHHDGKGHLLGCGGADGQVFVVDFSDLGSPNPAAPAPLEQGSHTAAITDVSWNSQVAHILASSDVSGTVNVWDLKNNRRWCQIVGRSPISCIQWNPEQGGILMSAVNDNARPRLQLWHLHQSTTAPLREYAEEHTGGITSMSWCKKDPDLLITCASDNRTLLWDLQQGKSVFEFPTAGAPAPAAAAAGAMPSAAATFGGMPTNSFGGAVGGRNVDVQWSKCIPSIASTCSFDRTLSMYACEAAGEQRPPRWFRRTVGASFSFGGKLSVFGASKQADSAQVVSVNEVRASEPAGMVARCEQFNALVDGAVALAPQKGAEAFVDVCEAKAAASSAEGRAGTGATWKLLRALFHTGQARTEQLLLHVGFNDADVMFRHKADEPAAVADAAEPPSPTIAAAAVAVAATPPPSADELFGASPAVSASDASAGFDMPAPVEDVAKAASPVALAPPPAAALSLAGASASLATTTGPVALDPVLEARLNTCVLVGDFAGAVECSIRAGRVADALLMAASAPDQPELWPIAQKAFFDQQSSRQAIKVVRAVMDDNLSDHVESSELSQWREVSGGEREQAEADSMSVRVSFRFPSSVLLSSPYLRARSP